MQVTQRQSRLLPLADARALASREGWREKVLAYITRGNDELLVFEHTPEYTSAGIQVPAGGVNVGETPEQAVTREVLEETGLRLNHPVYLVSHEWLNPAPSRIRHYYWLTVPLNTPDAWQHVVSGGDDDDGMTFLFRFAPIEQPELISSYGYETALPHLQHLMKENRP
ncbi:Nudix hydrolase domain-containing protein [Deinococcus saxicola]|uniref:NUDIX hydrolase n=1 Tax=Deinococcus saxicola TaxID=249406 RepID=UPI0039F085F4